MTDNSINPFSKERFEADCKAGDLSQWQFAKADISGLKSLKGLSAKEIIGPNVSRPFVGIAPDTSSS